MEKESKTNEFSQVVLLIIDGLGVAPNGEGNAISMATTPTLANLIMSYPATTLLTSGSTEKKINIGNSYIGLGTGRQKFVKETPSIVDYLDIANKKWLIISEIEKLSYGIYFMTGKKKINPDNYLLIPENTNTNLANRKQRPSTISTELLKKVKSRKYNFITTIISDIDLAAHTGNFDNTKHAIEHTDLLLKKIVKTVLENSGVVIITSTHGHAEEEKDVKTDLINKADTANPVPFILIGKKFEGKTLGFVEAPNGDLSLVPPVGSLLDITPTILKILNIEAPSNLDGKSLI